MFLEIAGRIIIFENKNLVDKISKEIDRFNKRILKLGAVDGCIYVSNSKEVRKWWAERNNGCNYFGDIRQCKTCEHLGSKKCPYRIIAVGGG